MKTTDPNSPPPKQTLYWQKALLWQSLGFLIIIVLTWSDALFDLAHAIFGREHQATDWNRTAIVTVVIVLLWIISAYKVYRVVSRLSYLESFLHVCAWCRKIEHEHSWMSLEEHFNRKTGRRASHGICPECSKKMLSEVEAEGKS
ncbi:MAG: hypothetical protein C5B50_23150 [Verrucomicrobia bacterium]|nr:MAG: hypothetical protein C5B50_23150 [Verrucomicrobiota bacterium]